MIEIKDLLVRFNRILFSEEFKKDSIIKILLQTIDISVKKEDIKIKNNIIYLNIKPIYKNEIFYKKEYILKNLREILGKKSPIDIK